MDEYDLATLDAWLAWRLARLRAELDNRERNLADERRRLRERMVGEQAENPRMVMQWYVTIEGTGHGDRTGVRLTDGPPAARKLFDP